MHNRLLTPQQLAELLQVPVATLYAWKYRGEGPRALKIGRHLRYAEDDVDAWLQSRYD